MKGGEDRVELMKQLKLAGKDNKEIMFYSFLAPLLLLF